MAIVRMNIGTRLRAAFAVLILVLIAVAGISLLRLAEFNTSVEDFSGKRVPRVIATANSTQALLNTARDMRDALVLDDEKQIKAAVADVERNAQQRRDLLLALGKDLASGKEQELLKAIVEASQAYQPLEDQFVKTVQRGDYEVQESNVEADRVRAAHASARWVILGVAALAVLFAVAISYFIVRSIVQPLQTAVRVTEAVASLGEMIMIAV